ncbi:MAG: hypothetical protein AB1568_16165 [Thermodesulfobacteriota bacterium]
MATGSRRRELAEKRGTAGLVVPRSWTVVLRHRIEPFDTVCVADADAGAVEKGVARIDGTFLAAGDPYQPPAPRFGVVADRVGNGVAAGAADGLTDILAARGLAGNVAVLGDDEDILLRPKGGLRTGPGGEEKQQESEGKR